MKNFTSFIFVKSLIKENKKVKKWLKSDINKEDFLLKLIDLNKKNK